MRQEGTPQIFLGCFHTPQLYGGAEEDVFGTKMGFHAFMVNTARLVDDEAGVFLRIQIVEIPKFR